MLFYVLKKKKIKNVFFSIKVESIKSVSEDPD